MASTKALDLPNNSEANEAEQAALAAGLEQARSATEGAVKEVLETSFIDRLKGLKPRKDKAEIKSIMKEWLSSAKDTKGLNAILDQCVEADLLTMKGKRYSDGPFADAYVDAKKDLSDRKKEEAAEAQPKPAKAEKKAEAPKLAVAPTLEVDEATAPFIERLQGVEVKFENKPQLYDIMDEAVEAGLITKEEVPNRRNPKGRPYTYFRPDSHPLVQELQRLTKEFNKLRNAANSKKKKVTAKPRNQASSGKKVAAVNLGTFGTFKSDKEFDAFIQKAEEGGQDSEALLEIEKLYEAGKKAEAPKLAVAPTLEVDEATAPFIERLQGVEAKFENKPQLYDIMDEAVEAGLITKEEVPNRRNPKGRPYTYFRPDSHPLVQELQRLTKAFNKQRRAANNKPEKKVELKEIKNPMAITMEDGKTFPNRDKFQQFIDKRLEKAETDEQKAELEAYKKAYVELLNEKLTELRKLSDKVRNQVLTAIKVKRHPDNKNGKPGVKDYMQPLFDEGLVFKENGNLKMPEGVTIAEPAIEAAYSRIAELRLAKDIQRKKEINSFEVNEKSLHFVYQISTSIDDLTGKKKVKVENVVSFYGKPTVKEGEYVIGIDAPNLLVLATKEYERRLAKREKARAKKDQKKEEAPQGENK